MTDRFECRGQPANPPGKMKETTWLGRAARLAAAMAGAWAVMSHMFF